MKKITPSIAFFNTMLICYLLASLIALSFNPNEWAFGLRVAYSILATISALMTYAIKRYDEEEESISAKYKQFDTNRDFK